ncbi:MAG TPA: cell wall-binding protein, partial [Lachnoclostridium sp.]|nr:cell wall-binding protein [Lachnoclostridium sp.]
YYCGDENDGAQRVGEWAYLDIVDNSYDSAVDPGVSSDNLFDDEDQTRYFYFKTNGKKMTDEKGKTINGK